VTAALSSSRITVAPDDFARQTLSQKSRKKIQNSFPAALCVGARNKDQQQKPFQPLTTG
jgi:hypothetical protein